jgi:hypothetical protein
VYWLHDEPTEKNPSGQKGMSRGFDKKTMEDSDFIHAAWKAGKSDLDVPSRRLITLGSSLMSDDFWEMRGLFVQSTRNLAMNGDNSKRYPVSVARNKLHKSLVNTIPQDLLEDYDTPLEHLMSEPYPISWLNLDADDDEGESVIAEIADADRSFYLDTGAAVDA